MKTNKGEKFRFREFSVDHSKSTMRVGTDAVVLGAWTEIGQKVNHILEVGTGCGIISLMLAQRSSAKIDAIDIHKESVEEASANFQSSPWPDRLQAIHSSLKDYADKSKVKYDLIVSNPPFFQNSYLPADEKLTISKHLTTIDFKGFLKDTFRLLGPKGMLSVILPYQERKVFIENAEAAGYSISKKLRIFPREGKDPNRTIHIYSKENQDRVYFYNIALRNPDGQFSDEYKILTQEFHPPEFFTKPK